MIHTAHIEYPLSSQDRTPSLKLAHQDQSTITYKKQTTPKTEKQENKLFDALETPHLQQLSQGAELRFSAFIDKKGLTLFLVTILRNLAECFMM